ncbi:MAG: hypothetical protein IJT75_07285 [Bacteroidaceae bacterium]|nr:hypothetical protein [Bacteroidaceae bacterium]
MFDNLEGLLAITLSLAVPIIAILMVFISEIKKKRRDTEVRLALIQQGTDAETAKILIEQQPKKNDKYSNLRAGFILVGIGLGAAVDALIGLSPKHNIYFWLIIAAGMGVGLLTSFVIEYKLTQKERQENTPQ